MRPWGGDKMRSRTALLAACSPWRRSAPRPPTSWCGGRRGTTPRRTRRSGRSSPPSSKRPARMSSSSFYPQDELPEKILAALEAGSAARLRLRLFASATTSDNGPSRIGSWTSQTPSAIFRTCSIRTRSSAARCSTRTPGKEALYGLPMGRTTNHVHVWKSLLERAGFTLADIPKEWDAFWSFWCDQVQPAVREATRPRRYLGCRPAHVGRGGDDASPILPVPGCLRGGLRDPRRPAGH